MTTHDDQQLLSVIRGVLDEVCEHADTSNISMTTDLREDLGVDSFMAMDLAFSLSEELDCEMPFERWYTGQAESGNYSVQALVDFVQGEIAKKEPSADKPS